MTYVYVLPLSLEAGTFYSTTWTSVEIVLSREITIIQESDGLGGKETRRRR